MGAIYIMAFFHLLVYFWHRYEKPLLYFGVFALLIASKFLLSGEFTIHMITEPIWVPMVKSDYLSFYLAAPFFLLYIRSLYPKEVPLITLKIVLPISLIFSLSVLLFPL